eukprot:2831018-Rhodomonas_salina.1
MLLAKLMKKGSRAAAWKRSGVVGEARSESLWSREVEQRSTLSGSSGCALMLKGSPSLVLSTSFSPWFKDSSKEEADSVAEEEMREH